MNEISSQGKSAKKDSLEIQKLSNRLCYLFYFYFYFVGHFLLASGANIKLLCGLDTFWKFLMEYVLFWYKCCVWRKTFLNDNIVPILK